MMMYIIHIIKVHLYDDIHHRFKDDLINYDIHHAVQMNRMYCSVIFRSSTELIVRHFNITNHKS